jgi:flagellar protein FlgJ
MNIDGLPLYIQPQDITDSQRAERMAKFADSRETDRAELQKAAREFESYFISYLLKVMRQTVPGGPFDSKAAEQFYSFYDQELGRIASERGALGLGRLVEEHVSRNIPVSDPQVLNMPNRYEG